MGSFENQVFLVTGASSGIGREVALQLVAQGAKVIAMARTAPALDALRDACAHPDRLRPFVGDVTVESACREAVSVAQGTFGRLDGLVHAAGISMRGRAAETDLAVFRRLMDVNYFSTVMLAQAALPALRESRGHLVVISSVVGHVAPPNRSGYAASKHAVQGFMNALRAEEAATGLHVLTVCPGWARTNMSMNALEPDGRPHGQMDETTARGLEPATVAASVLTAIARRRRAAYPAGLKERVALALARWAPGVLARVMAGRAAAP